MIQNRNKIMGFAVVPHVNMSAKERLMPQIL